VRGSENKEILIGVRQRGPDRSCHLQWLEREPWMEI